MTEQNEKLSPTQRALAALQRSNQVLAQRTGIQGIPGLPVADDQLQSYVDATFPAPEGDEVERPRRAIPPQVTATETGFTNPAMGQALPVLETTNPAGAFAPGSQQIIDAAREYRAAHFPPLIPDEGLLTTEQILGGPGILTEEVSGSIFQNPEILAAILGGFINVPYETFVGQPFSRPLGTAISALVSPEVGVGFKPSRPLGISLTFDPREAEGGTALERIQRLGRGLTPEQEEELTLTDRIFGEIVGDAILFGIAGLAKKAGTSLLKSPRKLTATERIQLNKVLGSVIDEPLEDAETGVRLISRGTAKQPIEELAAEIKPITIGERVGLMPSTSDLLTATFDPRSAVALKLGETPITRTIMNLFSRMSTSKDPISHLGIIRGKLNDVGEAFSFLAVTEARRKSKTGTAGFLEDVLPTRNGIVTRKDIVQTDPLPGGKQSLAAHDIIEYSGRYSMPDNVRELVNEIRRTSRDLSRMLEAENVPFKRLKRESDWVYLHRFLVSQKQERIKSLAELTDDTLQRLGTLLPRTERETPYEYLTRFTEGVRDGAIKNTQSVRKLIKEVADIVDVPIRRQSLTKRREFELVIDGLRTGRRYSDDVVQELLAQARLSYRMVVNNRIGDALQQFGITRASLISAEVTTARDAARTTRNLANQLKKAVKGERAGFRVISNKTMQQIAEEFPEEAAALQHILAIRMPDVMTIVRRLSQEFRAELGITPTRFRTVLGEVRQGVKPRSPVTNTELSQTLRQVGANQQQSGKMLERIYENATSFPIQERRAALDALLPSIEKLAEEAHKRFILANRRFRSAQKEAIRIAESPETGQIIGVPGISGRIVPTQVLNGKEILGVDLADEIRKTFGYMPKNWVEKDLLDRLGTLASVYRLAKASLDLSRALIQGSGMLGIDFYKLVTSPIGFAAQEMGLPVRVRLTNSFLPGLKGDIFGFIDPRHELNYWRDPIRVQSAVRRVRAGGLIQPSEFTEGMGIIANAADKLPLIGPRMSNLVRQTFGRADAAWSAGRNISAQAFWESMERTTATQFHGPLARMTNLLSGSFSLQGVGLPRVQQSAMNAVGFFAPRFTWAQFALVGNIFGGRIQSSLALQSMAGIAMANTTIFTLWAMALGQKPEVNPLPRKLGGSGSAVWTVKIGNRRLGVGGLLYSPMRLISTVSGDAVDEPENLVKFSMDNPVVRQYRGKSAGPTSQMWSYLEGRNFIGERVRSPDSLLPNKDTVDFLSRLISPIWLDELRENPSLLTFVAEWFGMRTYPESFWTIYRRTVEEADELGRDFGDIPGVDRALLASRNPDVQDALDAARDDSKKRGWNPLETEYWGKYTEYDDSFNSAIIRAEERFRTDPLFNRKDFRNAVSRQRDILRGKRLGLEADLRYRSVLADLNAAEPKSIEDKVWRDFNAILNDDANWDDVTGFPKKSLDDQFDALERATDREIWAKIEERSQIRMRQRPLVYQMLIDSLNRLRPYWKVQDDFEIEFPRYADMKSQIAQARKTGDLRTVKRLEDSRFWKSAGTAIAKRRLDKRIEDDVIDALLRFWAYPGDTKTRKGFDLWKQLMNREIDDLDNLR